MTIIEAWGEGTNGSCLMGTVLVLQDEKVEWKGLNEKVDEIGICFTTMNILNTTKLYT